MQERRLPAHKSPFFNQAFWRQLVLRYFFVVASVKEKCLRTSNTLLFHSPPTLKCPGFGSSVKYSTALMAYTEKAIFISASLVDLVIFG